MIAMHNRTYLLQSLHSLFNLLLILCLFALQCSEADAQEKSNIANGMPLASTQEGTLGKGTLRSEFFSLDLLDEPTRKLSEDLLFKALDSEAFYTLVGQLKPVSEGFWGGLFHGGASRSI